MADVITVDLEAPIIDLFRSLVTHNITQNTVVTDAQLIEILEKEFSMDTNTLHKFEVEVYLNVLKKFIKNWPEWDQFEQAVIKLKETNDSVGISKILKEKYINIKEYLRGMLNAAQELAKSKINEIKMKEQHDDNNGVEMEVEATRQQLNCLFYRQPLHNNIFNVTRDFKLGLHNSKMLTLESIVNWWEVAIEISVKADNKFIIYRRRNVHRLKHALVNKELASNTRKTADLNEQILVKSRKINRTQILREQILEYFEKVLKFDKNSKWRSVLDILKNILLNDFKSMPKTLSIPCDFRRYISKTKYIRYLYQDVPNNENNEGAVKFDLQLEEIVSPMCQFQLRTCGKNANMDVSFENAIKIICTNCHLTFTGANFVWNILKHFSDDHNEEPDWMCLKCNRVFTMPSLTHMGWTHTCDVS
ncbi:unnamed protein product [Parnassius apollo]|uniref:(apollo) hypothetical protein n=1 Tax=Parnassius apollo TaxID=110799 RepID=A0A8S3XQX7_PARAO|nr:unnamed protein product [Parnassius apollo]